MGSTKRRYMVKVTLPTELTEEFLRKIPAQRKRVNELMREGAILSYALALDRAKLWIVMQDDSDTKVMDVLATFPLIRYMSVEVEELMFHEAPFLSLQPISLN